LNGYQVEAKAKQILAGLSFREKDFDRPAREMSGGWVMRAHLARLLTQEPDLLMLDEPTNHLDLEALLWFQEYLQGYPGAILVISHDREFLNALISHIVEIRMSKLIRYRGNYDDSYLDSARRTKRSCSPPTRISNAKSRTAGFRRSLPRQGLQGRAGAEQAQADRAHGEDRSADQRRQKGQLLASAAATQRAARHPAQGHPFRLRPERGVPRHRF
jgi:ATPase subunit of ABC transporter with duplicated ATPase domains